MCPSPQKDPDPDTPGVDSTAKGFLVVRLRGGELQLAHHNADGWAETWTRVIKLGNGPAAGAAESTE
jgi:hypothetical protein